MSARGQAPIKAGVPLENLKPRRGMLVLILETPGVWQVMDAAPGMVGGWWLTPWDDAAREAEPDKEWGAYRKANWRTLRPASQAGAS